MSRWSWVLCSHEGEPLPGAHVARGRRLIAARNQATTALLTLSLQDQAATELFAALRNGIPQLRVYKDDTLVCSGLWTPMNGASAAGEQSHVNLVFKDAFAAVLAPMPDIGRFTDATVTYTAEDAGAIARDLIDTTNTDHGDTTIETSASWVQATKDRDRAYGHKNVAEAIVELTEVLDGFDWYPTYLDPRENDGKTMRFNIVASQGEDKEAARFEFGDGTLANCTGYQFTTALPVNHARALGADNAGTPFVGEKTDATSMALYGTYMLRVSASDVNETATLEDKAQDALRPTVVQVTEFSGDPALCPQPWDDFWIGDTVRCNIDDGAVQEQTSPRVQTIEVGLDDSDNIDDLKVGIDPAASGGFLTPVATTRRYVAQQRDLLRRLSALERR